MTADRPKPDPKAGINVYGYQMHLSPVQYAQPQIRTFTEEACQEFLRRSTGLEHEWHEWRHWPARETEDDDGNTVMIPEQWVYTCEARGPEGLGS